MTENTLLPDVQQQGEMAELRELLDILELLGKIRTPNKVYQVSVQSNS